MGWEEFPLLGRCAALHMKGLLTGLQQVSTESPWTAERIFNSQMVYKSKAVSFPFFFQCLLTKLITLRLCCEKSHICSGCLLVDQSFRPDRFQVVPLKLKKFFSASHKTSVNKHIKILTRPHRATFIDPRQRESEGGWRKHTQQSWVTGDEKEEKLMCSVIDIIQHPSFSRCHASRWQKTNKT